MLTALLRIAAWGSLTFILFATVSPIGLRPHDILPVNLDRALAYFMMSALFSLAYPRYWIAVLFLAPVGAGSIELLQHFSPTRHAHFSDAAVKAAGALVGALVAIGLSQLISLLREQRALATHESMTGTLDELGVEEDQEPEKFDPEVKVLWSSDTNRTF